MELPFTRGLRDTLAPPRAAAVTVTLAPPATMPATVHASRVSATEESMIGTMQDLRIDVVEKNAELEATLAALAVRREAALKRLVDTIAPARLERLAEARAGIETALTLLAAEVGVDTAARFAGVVGSLETPRERLDSTAKLEAAFYGKEVAAIFEADCGEAVRHMERSQYELDMDKLSTVDREKKINARFNEHCKTFRQRGENETADRSAQFDSLAKSFATDFSVLEASAISSAARYPAAIQVEADALASEVSARESGDNIFGEKMIESLSRIREIALSAYGNDESDGDE